MSLLNCDALQKSGSYFVFNKHLLVSIGVIENTVEFVIKDQKVKKSYNGLHIFDERTFLIQIWRFEPK